MQTDSIDNQISNLYDKLVLVVLDSKKTKIGKSFYITALGLKNSLRKKAKDGIIYFGNEHVMIISSYRKDYTLMITIFAMKKA